MDIGQTMEFVLFVLEVARLAIQIQLAQDVSKGQISPIIFVQPARAIALSVLNP